ncbi:MAG: 50S ribosomal protein L31e [Promethearchaeota archaeon]
MAKKKIIKKKVTPPPEEKKEEIEEVPKEDVDAFDLKEAPVSEEELSDIEQEIKEAETEFDEEIQEERYYVVPLARTFQRVPRWKRSKKAMIALREFLTRHMKPEGDVYISQELNERVWENGIKNPPRKIRVRVTKSVDGIVRAYLA